jgi:hypothetical protein
MIISTQPKQFIKIPAAVNNDSNVLLGALETRLTARPSSGWHRVLRTGDRLQLPKYNNNASIQT